MGATQHGAKVFEESSHEARTPLIFTEGYLKKKNWLILASRIAQKSPRTHARTVDTGIVGSSVLGTADRTSGYGDSSSSVSAVASKLGSLSLSVKTVILSYYYQLGAISGTRERND